jgi:hypothetical protein
LDESILGTLRDVFYVLITLLMPLNYFVISIRKKPPLTAAYSAIDE